MKTLIQFRNFDGLEHLEDFVENTIDQTVGKFESWRHFNIHVVLRTIKGRTALHRPVFECELMIKGKGLNRPIVVKKNNPDFYKAVRACMKASEKIFRRSAKIRVTRRRHPELKQPTDVDDAA